MKRKLLSVLLLVCALATLLTVSAFADEGAEPSTPPTTAEEQKAVSVTVNYYDADGTTCLKADTQTITMAKPEGNKFQVTVNYNAEKDGHALSGWAYAPGATTVTVTNGSQCDTYVSNWAVAPTSTLNLYAVWTKTHEECTVIFEPNGGTGGNGTTTVWAEVSTMEAVINGGVPTRKNYSFKGWAASEDAATATYQNGDNYDFLNATTVTLYAVWERTGVDYEVTYNANGGAFEGGSQTKKDEGSASLDGKITINGGTPTREGFIFKGWASSADAAAATVQNGDSWILGLVKQGGVVKATTPAEFFAVWEKDVTPPSGGQTGDDDQKPTGGDDQKPTGDDDQKPTGDDDQKPTGGDDQKPTGGDDQKPEDGKKPEGEKKDEPKTDESKTETKPESKATGTKEADKLPKTGDESQLGLWIVLSVSALVVGGVLILRKKHSEG